MNEFLLAVASNVKLTYVFNFTILLLSILVFNFILLKVFKRNQSDFNALFRKHIKTLHSEMLIYNYRRDRFACVSEGNNFFSGLNLHQFACQFVESEALMNVFARMRSDNGDCPSFICNKLDDGGIVVLYMHPVRRLGKVRQVDIILRMDDALNRRAKKLSFDDFRSMFDLVSTGFVLCDAEGTIIDINQSAQNIFGIPDKESLLARKLSIFSDPHYKGPKTIADFSNSGALYIYQFDFDTMPHSVFARNGQCTFAIRYYRMENEGEVKIVVIVADLSSDVISNSVFASMYNEQQTILNVSSVGYAVYNTDGIFGYANNAFFDIFGITDRKGYKQQDYRLFDSPILPDAFKNDIRKYDVAETTVHFEFTDEVCNLLMSDKKGAIDLKFACQRVKALDGTKSSYVLCITDITDTATRMREIEELDKNKAMLMRIGGMSAWTLNLRTGNLENIYEQDETLNLWNRKKMLEILHPEDINVFNAVVDNMINGVLKEARNILRIRNANVDGGYSYYEFVAEAISDSTNVEKLGVVAREVTSQTLYKRTLEQERTRTSLTMHESDLVQFDVDIEKDNVTIYEKGDRFSQFNSQSLNAVLNMAHPEDLPRVLELTTRMRSKEDFSDTIFYKGRFSQESSDWHDVQIYVTPLSRNDDGTVRVYTGLLRDNTYLVKMMENQEESNFLLNTFMNAVPSLFYVKDIDDDLRYVYSNNLSCQIVKKQSSDFVGRTTAEVFASVPDFDVSMENEFDRLAIEHGYYEYDATTDFYGEKKTWHTTKEVIETQTGHKYLLAVSQDVTQLYDNIGKLQKIVMESDHMNRLQYTFINSLPCLFYMKDIDEGLRYSMINDKCCDLIGFDRNYIIGKTDEQIIQSDVAARFVENDKLAIKFGNYEYNEEGNWHGEKSMWHTQKKVLDIDGHRYLLATALDITQMYRAFDELKVAKQKAEQADKLKSSFLANMSHEIRTPLNAICGFSSLLAECDDPETRTRYSNYVSTNSDVLLNLINDILDMSKLEAGYANIKPVQFDLSAQLNETYETFKKQMKPTVNLIFHNPYEICMVYFDKNRFIQIVNNYVSNAMKYTVEGNICIDYRKEGEGIMLSVEDTGIGISEEDRPRVFSRFEKLDTFAQGSGLGLAICKSIAEAVGGKVGFTSEKGKGSRFYAWLPMPVEVATHESDVKNSDTHQKIQITNDRKISVLVAEDNDSNYQLVEALLPNMNLRRAVNGKIAVEMAQMKKYDIILMDVRMPVMEGLEATQKIREFDQKTPILALTANSFDSDQEAAMKAGCSGYLAKPIRKKDLYDAINKVLNLWGGVIA